MISAKYKLHYNKAVLAPKKFFKSRISLIRGFKVSRVKTTSPISRAFLVDSILSESTYTQIERSGHNSTVMSTRACGADRTKSNVTAWLIASEIRMWRVAQHHKFWTPWLTALRRTWRDLTQWPWTRCHNASERFAPSCLSNLRLCNHHTRCVRTQCVSMHQPSRFAPSHLPPITSKVQRVAPVWTRARSTSTC